MRSSLKHIIFRISKEGVFYNSSEYIAWEKTNFPHVNSFKLKDREDIYWKLKMVDFNRELKLLSIQVIDFNPKEYQVFEEQAPKTKVEALHFLPMDWNELQDCFTSYVSNDFDSLKRTQSNWVKHNYKPKIIFEDGIKKFDFTDEVVEFKFSYPILKLQFKAGYIQFEQKIESFREPLMIRIFNAYIIPEFDFIKPYFAKVLGKKKIEVTGNVKIEERALLISAYSKDIVLINQTTISNIKRLNLEEKIKRPNIQVIDKSLFTSDDYFEDYELNLGNTSKKSDYDLLMDLLEIKSIRNTKQLNYLAGKLHSESAKLRFTLSPEFGFLFYVKGEQLHHFIWELLDSNATYLWSMENSIHLEAAFLMIESKINFIRNHSRSKYIQQEPDQEVIFNKIIHEHANSSLIDGFPKWREKLNEKLI